MTSTPKAQYYQNDVRQYLKYNRGVLFSKVYRYSQGSKVPEELVIKIVEYLLEVSWDQLGVLCAIAQVCEPWRQMVFRTKSFWKNVNIKLMKVDVKLSSQGYPRYCEHGLLVGLHSRTIEIMLDHGYLTYADETAMDYMCDKSVVAVVKQRPGWLADYLAVIGSELGGIRFDFRLNQSYPSVLQHKLDNQTCSNLTYLSFHDSGSFALDLVELLDYTPNLVRLDIISVDVKPVKDQTYKRFEESPQDFAFKKLECLGLGSVDQTEMNAIRILTASEKITTLELYDVPSYPVTAQSFQSEIWKRWKIRKLILHDKGSSDMFRASQGFREKWAETLKFIGFAKMKPLYQEYQLS